MTRQEMAKISCHGKTHNFHTLDIVRKAFSVVRTRRLKHCKKAFSIDEYRRLKHCRKAFSVERIPEIKKTTLPSKKRTIPDSFSKSTYSQIRKSHLHGSIITAGPLTESSLIGAKANLIESSSGKTSAVSRRLCLSN